MRPAVHGHVEELFGAQLTPEDLAPRRRKGIQGEPAWQNNLDSLYDRLKKRGSFATLSRGSMWTLTEVGAREAGAYLDIAGPVIESDLLSNFRPKDASDYPAHIEGRELIKHRAHEKLVNDYGHFAASQGWRARTDVHPRDLVLQRDSHELIVEAKTVCNGNATDGVRAALAQLLMYRYFLYSPPRQPDLLALFDGPIGDAYVEFLTDQGVATVWWDDGTWRGSAWTGKLGLRS